MPSNSGDAPRNAGELVEYLRKTPDAMESFRAEPMAILGAVAAREKHPQSDSFIYRLVVITLALVITCIVGGELVLHIFHAVGVVKEVPKIPDFLIAACSTAIGALAGLLAPIQN